jgi:D-xylose reductase
VLLRWGVQRRTVVIPKTSSPDHLQENLAIFDFELSPEEMSQLNALDQHRRFNDPGVFCEGAFKTFFPIYE